MRYTSIHDQIFSSIFFQIIKSKLGIWKIRLVVKSDDYVLTPHFILMKTKKNQKTDLRQKSFLFFQLGLAFMLTTSLILIEFKTYEKEASDPMNVELSMLDMEDEDIPITVFRQTPPPPPPPTNPDTFDVKDDDEDVDESIFDYTEPDFDDIPSPAVIDDISKEEDIEEFTFENIQEVPVFPGCEKMKTNEERKECMSKKINEFVNKKFDTSLGINLGLKGVNRVYVLFKIDQQGNVVDVQARSNHPKLTKEGERVVGQLPSMQPGKQRGRAVGVIYTLPITFQVQD